MNLRNENNFMQHVCMYETFKTIMLLSSMVISAKRDETYKIMVINVLFLYKLNHLKVLKLKNEDSATRNR